MKKNAVDMLCRGFWIAPSPKPEMTLSQWADKFPGFVLPGLAAEPGRWISKRFYNLYDRP